MKYVRYRDSSGEIQVTPTNGETVIRADRSVPLEDLDVLAPVAPSKVLGVAHNYRGLFEDGTYPDRPRLWFKGGPNVVTGHGETIEIPAGDDVVFEAELGVVIGTTCRDVPPESVPNVIAGYTCVNDLTNMSREDDVSMFRKKSFDDAASIGPVLATPDDVPANPRVRLWCNGEQRQDSAGDSFVFSVAEVVAAVSAQLTLNEHDVIMMGNPGEFEPLADGDSVVVEVEGVGRLRNEVVAR